MNVIGLTGAPCSGKGTVKDVLFAMCAERGLTALHFSFSDEIKAEAIARGIPEAEIDRDCMIGVVGGMRKAEGPGVLAGRVARRVAENPADVYVVEAVRHPAEVDALRHAFGHAFTLAAVVAEVDTMAQRLIDRPRADESRTAKKSPDVARNLVQRELTGGEGTSVQVGRCIAMADVTLPNTGTLEDLEAAVRTLFDAILPARA